MNYYNEIKQELINNEINKKVKDYSKNKNDLDTYYRVGEILSNAGKHYGESIIKEYSDCLVKDVDREFNTINLKRMRQFYLIVKKGATVWHQLSWSHYKILIPLKSIDKINYYGGIAVENLYSVRDLEDKIKSKEYERLDNKTKLKIINNNETNIIDLVKNPIQIKNNSKKDITEKILKKLILEDIES